MTFGDVTYHTSGRVATITLNRPDRYNAISESMPDDIAAAFNHASEDDDVHVVVLTGAGRGFCGGYDLRTYAEQETPAIQQMPWDATVDYRFMQRCTQQFMSIWRCTKPVMSE